MRSDCSFDASTTTLTILMALSVQIEKNLAEIIKYFKSCKNKPG